MQLQRGAKPHPTISDVTLRAWFLKALAELKYCGLVSGTRQSTFLFKKNFYGKPAFNNLI